MLNKALFAAVILAGASSPAFAQGMPTNSPGGAPDGNAQAFMLPTPPNGMRFSEAMIRKYLEARGFRNIDLSEEVGSGGQSGGGPASSGQTSGKVWSGTAEKGGKTFNIQVDGNGLVTDRTRR